jgi:subtilase family serine protease
LSANSVLDAGDLAFDPPHAVPLLQPGASNSAVLTVTIPADTPAGVRYLIAVADAEGDAIESSESNNTRVRSVSIGPDLTLTDLTVPSTAAPGKTITIWDTVRNQGGGGAAPSATTFYLSVNSALDASDTALSGTRTVPALEPGASSAGASVVNIPTVITVGQYYVIAKADGGGAVAESSETNNTSARSIRIGADLTVSALAAPATSGAGLSIQISDTTRNEGTTAADTSVTRIFFSTNSQLDAADVEVGARTVPGLAPGANSSAAMTVTIPSGTATGTYYLLAVADADGAVSETNETNNRYARSLQLGGDLRVTVVTAPASASPGSSIIVSDTTTNQGGGAAAPTTTLYYFSANITLDTLDVSLGGRAVPALAPNATHSGSATVTVPAGVAPGTYYILAKADGQNVEAETQETNNISARAIQVGGDLAVSALSVPAIGGAGLTIVVTDTTVNQGTAPVAASATRFYLSSNGSLDGSDLALPPGRTIPDLPVGASSSGSTTLTIPAATATGTYYVIAKADGDGNVGETLETNNTSARVLQIGPDLAVSALSLPDEIAPGATFGANATTVNQGGGAAPSSATSFFLSANYSLDSDDVALLPTLVVGALASGATSSATAGLTIPGGTAPGTYYVIAKADADGGTVETSEGNNTRTRSTRVGPDLSVSSTSLSSTTVRAGGTATVTDTVVNQGAGVAAASTLRFYLSANITFDAADVVLPGSRTVPGLATDATSSGSTVITIPLATASGTYYVITKIDADGTVPECTETNNTRVVRSIQVTMPE